ncbi:heme/steroid binding protein-like protein [Cryomyces antarcticus]
MVLLSFTVLLILLSLFIYRQPPASHFMLLQWFRPSTHPPAEDSQSEDRDSNLVEEEHEKQRRKSVDICEKQAEDRKHVTGGDTTPIDSPVGTPPSPQTTPKAIPPTVPSFSLESANSSEDEGDLPPLSFPALNSIQRAGASMKPPPPPSLAFVPPKKPLSTPSSRLMPPPPRPSTNRTDLLPPSSAASLRVPATGPLPNRGPPGKTTLSPSTTVKTPNPRNKVLLTPGHSPLDWAALQKSSPNLSGVSTLLRVTPSQLAHHNGRRDRTSATKAKKPAWSAWRGKVYNLTPYLPFHPGGEGELLRAAGKHGDALFNEVHPWVNWENMLGSCLVGVLVAEEEGEGEGRGSALEEMD